MATSIAPARLAAWRAFLTAHSRVVGRLEDELVDEVGLPLSWYEVLLILQESAHGRLRMHELASSRLLSRSAATRLVDRMEASGLVRRSTCDSDRRGTFVELSDRGRHTLRRAAPVHLRGVDDHFTAHLSTEEAEILHDIFERISDKLAPTLG